MSKTFSKLVGENRLDKADFIVGVISIIALLAVALGLTLPIYL